MKACTESLDLKKGFEKRQKVLRDHSLPSPKTIGESSMELLQPQGFSDGSSEVMNWDNTLDWTQYSEYPGWTYYKFPKVTINCLRCCQRWLI